MSLLYIYYESHNQTYVSSLQDLIHYNTYMNDPSRLLLSSPFREELEYEREGRNSIKKEKNF